MKLGRRTGIHSHITINQSINQSTANQSVADRQSGDNEITKVVSIMKMEHKK